MGVSVTQKRDDGGRFYKTNATEYPVRVFMHAAHLDMVAQPHGTSTMRVSTCMRSGRNITPPPPTARFATSTSTSTKDSLPFVEHYRTTYTLGDSAIAAACKSRIQGKGRHLMREMNRVLYCVTAGPTGYTCASHSLE